MDEPYEDVPPHLWEPLRGWLYVVMSNSMLLTEYIVLTRRLEFPDVQTNHSVVIGALLDDAAESDALTLDNIELALASGGVPDAYRTRLEQLLTTANSAYAVRPDGRGLEMRVLPETRKMVDDVVRQASSIGTVADHLSAAWNAAFSRTADPVRSYSESIKAVEAAVAPVVTPKDMKATLGTLIGELDAHPDKWEAVLASRPPATEAVVVMMRTLWTGQTSRHGGVTPTVPETIDMAQAAVFLAVAVVQWFISGAVRRSET